MRKILHVDLSSGAIREEEFDIDLAREFIRGFGSGARLICDLIKHDIDPLSPENLLKLAPVKYNMILFMIKGWESQTERYT